MARNVKVNADRGGRAAHAGDVNAAAEWFARRDTGLTTAEEAAFQRWIAADAANREAYAEIEATWSSFGRPRTAGEASQVEVLLERRARRRRNRRIIAGTAMVVLLLLAILGPWSFVRNAGGPSVARATIMAPSRQVLPDGTVVLLKQGARVREAYSAGFRRVELTQGEAMFEVRKNPSRPFIVAANGVEVRAVGTAFSVQLDRSQVEVVIAEGTVAIAAPAPPGVPSPASRADAHDETRPPVAEPVPAAHGVLVKAGNRVLIRREKSGGPEVTPMAEQELHERLAWRQPRVEFSNAPLRDAVDLLNREAGRTRLVIADPELTTLRVSGIFRVEQLDSFVLLLEAGFGVRAERSPEAIRLYRATNAPMHGGKPAN